jgi:hypothetical protein
VLNIFVGALMVVLAFSGLAALALAPLSATLAAPLARVAEASAALMTHSVDPFCDYYQINSFSQSQKISAKELNDADLYPNKSG